MSRLSRAEFIEINFGPKYRLDIRATIGRMTMPAPEEEDEPSFRAKDVLEKLGGLGLKNGAALYHIGGEIGQMNKIGMIHMVDSIPPQSPNGGVHYKRSEAARMARAGWDIVRRDALTIVELYPDAIQNQAWQEFVIPEAGTGG